MHDDERIAYGTPSELERTLCDTTVMTTRRPGRGVLNGAPFRPMPTGLPHWLWALAFALTCFGIVVSIFGALWLVVVWAAGVLTGWLFTEAWKRWQN
jgi:hypothetical protein